MIIEKKNNDVIVDESLDIQGKMRLADGAGNDVVRMLTRAYSDPIGSIIRESISNSSDSHIMANNPEPVICRLFKDETEQWYFEAIDMGLGLDDEDFHKYIMGVGASSKIGIPGVLGNFGIGSKAASSHVDQYFYTCRKNSVERKYMVFQKDDEVLPALLYTKDTEEPNGVIVNVPVPEGEYRQWQTKCKEQLAYFDNVKFEVPGIFNDHTIFRGDVCQYSTLSPDTDLHITLGNVYYPLNFKKLGIDRINVPVALRFSLTDGINPIPNREEIEYTGKAKQIILNKIQEVANWLVDHYNANLKEYTDWEKCKELVNPTWYNCNLAGHVFDIKPILKYTDKFCNNPVFKGLQILTPADIKSLQKSLLGDKFINGLISSTGSWRTPKHPVLLETSLYNSSLYIADVYEKPKGYLRKYLNHLSDSRQYGNILYGVHWTSRRLRKSKDGPHKGRGEYYHIQSYYDLLRLDKHPKSEWRARIQDFQLAANSYIKNSTSLKEILDSEEYKTFVEDTIAKEKRMKAMYPKVKKERVVGTPTNIVLGILVYSSRSVYQYKVEKTSYPLNTLHKSKKVCIHFSPDEIEKARQLANILYETRDTHLVCVTSSKDYAKIKHLHNHLNYTEYMNSKPFARLCTAVMFNRLLESYKTIINSDNLSVTKFIDPNISDHYKLLKKYVKNNECLIDNHNAITLIEHAHSQDLYDKTLWDSYLAIKKIVDEYGFLEFMKVSYGFSTSEEERQIKKLINSFLLLQKKQYKRFTDVDIRIIPKAKKEVKEQIQEYA